MSSVKNNFQQLLPNNYFSDYMGIQVVSANSIWGKILDFRWTSLIFEKEFRHHMASLDNEW